MELLKAQKIQEEEKRQAAAAASSETGVRLQGEVVEPVAEIETKKNI